MLQLRADSDSSHRPQHPLALMANPSTLTKEELTTTERFDRLEGQLNEQADAIGGLKGKLNEQANAIDGLRHQFADVSGRLQTLEGLLERVLGCLGGNGHVQPPNPTHPPGYGYGYGQG